MLANNMFYKVRSNAHDILIFHKLNINLDTIITGVECALIVFQINDVSVLIFSKADTYKGALCVNYGGDQSKGSHLDVKLRYPDNISDDQNVCAMIINDCNSDSTSSSRSNKPDRWKNTGKACESPMLLLTPPCK